MSGMNKIKQIKNWSTMNYFGLGPFIMMNGNLVQVALI